MILAYDLISERFLLFVTDKIARDSLCGQYNKCTRCVKRVVNGRGGLTGWLKYCILQR